MDMHGVLLCRLLLHFRFSHFLFSLCRYLYWSNVLFANATPAGQRPLVLSRNGGLGNHRYPIGFSGDTLQSFVTLAYEIKMTPVRLAALKKKYICLLAFAVLFLILFFFGLT